MTIRTRAAAIAATVVFASLTFAACKKAETPAPTPTAAPVAEAPTSAPAPSVSVTDLSVGKALGPDKKVQSATDTFSPKDTIYAAVSTTGAASNATLGAKWTYQDGQTVNDSSQTIAPTGPAVTTFHISKPDGWPAGNYKVEISLNGTSVATKDFSVK